MATRWVRKAPHPHRSHHLTMRRTPSVKGCVECESQSIANVSVGSILLLSALPAVLLLVLITCAVRSCCACCKGSSTGIEGDSAVVKQSHDKGPGTSPAPSLLVGDIATHLMGIMRRMKTSFKISVSYFQDHSHHQNS